MRNDECGMKAQASPHSSFIIHHFQYALPDGRASATNPRGFRSRFCNPVCLRLTVHPVDAPLVDDHDALAEREEACELRLALEQVEVFVAAEGERRLGQLRFGLELRVNPDALALVEGLVADLLRAPLYSHDLVVVRAQGLLL